MLNPQKTQKQPLREFSGEKLYIFPQQYLLLKHHFIYSFQYFFQAAIVESTSFCPSSKACIPCCST